MLKFLRLWPLLLITLLWIPMSLQAEKINGKTIRLLIFHNQNGYIHKDTDEAVDSIKSYGEKREMEVVKTKDSTMFKADTLSTFHAVLFINTNYRNGRMLLDGHEKAFEDYIKNGGGFVGIHSAIPLDKSDMEKIWPWFADMFGARFQRPHMPLQNGDMVIEDSTHISTRGVKKRITVKDEWYPVQKNPREKVNVLAVMDGQSFQEKDRFTDDRPASWYREYQGGRTFVMLPGHDASAFKDSSYMKFLYGGILYASGVVEGCTDSSYVEYNSKANRNNGTCKTLTVGVGEQRVQKISLEQNGKHSLTIHFPYPGSYEIEIYNIAGEPIHRQQAQGRFTYEFSQLSRSGILFVKINTGLNARVYKVVTSAGD